MATPNVLYDAAVALRADFKQFDADLKTAEQGGRSSGNRLANALRMDFGNAQKVMAGAAAGLFGVLLKGGNDITEAMANYRAETGATAEEAADAQKVIGELFRTNIEGYDVLAGALAKVHTDLGLTGQAAKDATQLVLDYARATGQDAVEAVGTLDDLTDTFNLDAAQQRDILDKLVASHQKYGGSVSDAQAALIAMAPALNAANLDYDDGIGLLNMFAASGVDASVASTALTRALSKVKSPDELQYLIRDIQATEDPLLRAQKASDLFGVKAGTKLAQALSVGTGGLGEFAVSSDDAAGAVGRASDAIENTPLNQFKILLHNTLGPLGEFVAANQGAVMFLSAMPGVLALVSAAHTLLSAKQLATAAGWLADTAAIGAYNVVGLIATGITTGLAAAVNLLLGPVGLVILAVGLLFVAWQTNFLGIREHVDNAVQFITKAFGFLVAGIGVVGKAVGDVLEFVASLVDGIHDFLFGSEDAVKQSGRRIRQSAREELTPPAELHDSWERGMRDVVGTVNAAAPNMAAAASALAAEVPKGLEKGRLLTAHAAEAYLAKPLIERIVAAGPQSRAAMASTLLQAAAGLRDKRTAIQSAIDQLREDMKNRLTPKEEVGKRIGQLFSRAISKGLKDSDPVIKAQAEGTRALIEGQLIETIKAGGTAGKKIQEELEKKLKSKDPDVRAQAKRTKELIDAALKAKTGPKDPGDAIGDKLNADLGTKGTALYNTAYRLGKSIWQGLNAGVTGGTYRPPATSTGIPHNVPLDSFASGTGYVPEDMIAQIHKGEIIVDPQSSEAIRQGLAGIGRGGDTYTNTWVMPEPTRDPWEALEQTSRYARWGRLRPAPELARG